MSRALLAALALTVALTPSIGLGDEPSAAAVDTAATLTGVPKEILHAIASARSTRTDTPDARSPWPWTLTIAGQRRHFATREDAHAALGDATRLGISHIDIGLMQLNWRRYRHRLGDAWRALDPAHNAHVAAQILRAEWRRSGDLWVAVGRFHATTPAEAAAFRDLVGAEVVRSLARGQQGTTVQPRTHTTDG